MMTIDERLLEEARWIFQRLHNAENETDRAYYQGRIDSLATARRIVAEELEKVPA
jgi:hypothetical protein